MQKYISIGVDVGNFATKSSSTSFTSGYNVSTKKPIVKQDYLYFKDKYFIFDGTVFKYQKDKTKDERAIVLTLASIAKELLSIVEKRKCNNGIQYELDQISGIHLGVGLPPLHCATLGEKTKKYYEKYFENGIKFEYNDFKFNLKLGRCAVFPQDYSAAIAYKKDGKDNVKSYKSYVCIDIGGYTVDIILIKNGKPIIAQSASESLGIIKMYDAINNDIEQNSSLGISISYDMMESVLKEEQTILPADVIEIIKNGARNWILQIINTCEQRDIEFSVYPVLFIGGGSLLLKKYIKESNVFVKYEFIPTPNANANGYKLLIKDMAEKENRG